MYSRISPSSLPVLAALALTALPACSSSTGGTGGGDSSTSTTASTSSAGGGGGSGGEAATTTSTSSATSSTSTGAAPVCGDGTVDPGEACDDKNTADGDGCTKDCVKECESLHFVGATIATAADPSTLNVTSVTLAAWYNAVVGAPLGILAAKRGNTPGGHFTYQLGAGPGGLSARFQTNVSPDFLDISYPAAVPDGKWHHAAVTYDAVTGNGALFLDGVSVATGTKGAGLVAADPTQPFTIGGITLNGAPTGLSKADITDVVVYKTPLSGAEVMGLFQGKYPPAPLASFFTHEGMGLTSADASGNGHTLTVATDGWAADGPFCKP